MNFIEENEHYFKNFNNDEYTDFDSYIETVITSDFNVIPFSKNEPKEFFDTLENFILDYLSKELKKFCNN